MSEEPIVLPKPAWVSDILTKIDELGEIVKLREVLSRQISINRNLLHELGKLRKRIKKLEHSKSIPPQSRNFSTICGTIWSIEKKF